MDAKSAVGSQLSPILATESALALSVVPRSSEAERCLPDKPHSALSTTESSVQPSAASVTAAPSAASVTTATASVPPESTVDSDHPAVAEAKALREEVERLRAQLEEQQNTACNDALGSTRALKQATERLKENQVLIRDLFAKAAT